MNEVAKFFDEVAANVEVLKSETDLQSLSRIWLRLAIEKRYPYNFTWLGRPIIQYPQDIVAMQELIWSLQPELIVETGIAHGGSLIFSASMLELNAACGGPADARVVGIDIDIRAHNRAAIEAHPMFRRITMIEGSSVAADVVAQVRALVKGKQSVLVCLDSSHTHEHVFAELEVYAPMTTVGSYCVVFDTIVEDLPAELSADRPWGPGDNPKTAARRYLAGHSEFEIDHGIDHKLLIGVAPHGYLRRVR